MSIVEQLARDGGLTFPTEPAGQPIFRTLRWTTSLPGVTSVVWQILPYAPGISPDLTPPFAIDLWSEQVPEGTTSGSFGVDFSLYLEKPATVAIRALELGLGVSPETAILGDPILPGASPTIPQPETVSQAQPAIGGELMAPAASWPVAFLGDFYVRVVPMAGAVPMPASNYVRLSIGEAGTDGVIKPPSIPTCEECGSSPGALGVSWSFTLPTPANPKYTACAVVTGFAQDYLKPPAWWPYSYKVGKVLCPDPPDDGWSVWDAFDAVVSFVADVWDFVSSSYAWIKQQVVSAVLIAVPCQAIADKSVCESVANMALDAVAVGFGIPPSIPDFDATMAALKGDVVEFVVENAAKQFPAVALACDIASVGTSAGAGIKNCEDLAAIAVDEVLKQMATARSTAAGKATGKAWPGVLFEPDPRGQWQPPSVTFTATRTSDPVQPATCWVGAAMSSTLHDWEWPELVAGHTETGSGDIKGSPLLPEAVALPPLKPGESVTRTLWLDDYATWFESGDSYEYWYYAKALEHPNRAWALLQQGAQLTFTVSSNCGPTSSIGPVTLQKSATKP